MSGGMGEILALFSGEMVPQVAADIPVKTLEAITVKLREVAQERANSAESPHGFGYVAGRHDLVRELAEIIKREMAPAVELRTKLTEAFGE